MKCEYFVNNKEFVGGSGNVIAATICLKVEGLLCIEAVYLKPDAFIMLPRASGVTTRVQGWTSAPAARFLGSHF